MAEKGESPPLLIYPEGCTTNGRCLVKFRKGAFASLRGVKPFFSKVSSFTGILPVHGDAISFWAYLILFPGSGFSTFTLFELPVFTPNDYFWKNHWDGKEEKWELFARTVRQIIADLGQFEISESSNDDKVEYKRLVRGSKEKKKH